MSFPILIDMNLSPVSGAGPLILEAMTCWEAELRRGALMSVDETSRRIRLLPLRVS